MLILRNRGRVGQLIRRLCIRYSEWPRLGVSMAQPLVLLLLATTVAQADIRSRDLLPSAWAENLRFAIDLSARPIYETKSDEFSHIEFIGFDLHKVFSGAKGDRGTLLLQGYLTRLNNRRMRPAFFDDKNDWEFVYRIFNYNHVLLPRGRLNLRVGHFEIPFGLEQPINTNGTLRDYMHGRNLGVKADWGATVNGEFPNFEYELAWSRGSGNEWENKGHPGVWSGRLGSTRENSVVAGISVFDGEVYVENQPDFTIERQRIGVDLQWYFQRYALMGELAYGEDENRKVVNGLLEFDVNAKDGAWLAYLQLLRFSVDTDLYGWEHNLKSNLGVRYEPTNRWTLSAQWSRDLRAQQGVAKTNVIAGQLRYRF